MPAWLLGGQVCHRRSKSILQSFACQHVSLKLWLHARWSACLKCTHVCMKACHAWHLPKRPSKAYSAALTLRLDPHRALVDRILQRLGIAALNGPAEGVIGRARLDPAQPGGLGRQPFAADLAARQLASGEQVIAVSAEMVSRAAAPCTSRTSGERRAGLAGLCLGLVVIIPHYFGNIRICIRIDAGLAVVNRD